MLNYLERLQRIAHVTGGHTAPAHHERPHHRALRIEDLDPRIVFDASGNVISPLGATLNQQPVPAALVTAAAQQSTAAPVTVSEGGALSLQITVNGLNAPAGQLVYSLAPGAPQGAQINAQTGLLTWNVPTNFATGPVTLNVRVTEIGAPGLSVTEPVVVNVAAFNGFDLFTTGAVELGGFATGLAVDTGVVINGNLSVSPFGAAQPGALPAQAAALQQLAGRIPVTTGLADLGLAGRLPAGIVDMVIGFDSGIPHNVDAMELELARYGGSSGGGMSDQGVSPQKGNVQRAGGLETFDDKPGPRTDSGKIDRPTEHPLLEARRPAPFPGASPPGWSADRTAGERVDVAQSPRALPPLGLVPAAARVTDEAVAKAVAAQRSAAAVAATIMPLIVAQPPQRRYERRRPRLGRWLEPLGR